MQRQVGAFFLIAFASAPLHLAAAAGLPEVKTSARNPVPECATPGRLMAYLKDRNPELNSRFESVATEYMRLGEMLGVRWDYAFYQMIIETGALSYRRGNRSGDVKPTQNNFAGLGATGRGETGESFPDMASGVRAHMEHLLLYAGDKIESPTAERTRKVQEWGILTNWRASLKRPVTYSDLAAKWAPGSGSYGRMLEAVAERFENFCAQPDPRPHLVQEARGTKAKTVADAKPERPTGGDLARRAIIEDGNDQRSSLGAQQAAKAPPVPFKMLNAPPPASDIAKLLESPAATLAPPAAAVEAPAKAAADPGAKPKTKAAAAPPAAKGATDKPPYQVASAAGAAKPLVQPPATGQKCRVWTASYGGQKALIIRSVVDKVVNFTVLDVNEGAESREADAFISAYAKDGAIAGEFGSQTQALDKAFELCPEG